MNIRLRLLVRVGKDMGFKYLRCVAVCDARSFNYRYRVETARSGADPR
jgi:hypothetical protein